MRSRCRTRREPPGALRRPTAGCRGCCGGLPPRVPVRHPSRSGSPRACRRGHGDLRVFPSEAEVAERARRPFQAELVGKRECSLGGRECGVTSAVQEVRTRDLGERLDVRGALGQRFQQRQGLGRQLDPAWIGQAGEQAGEHVHGVRRGGEIAALLEAMGSPAPAPPSPRGCGRRGMRPRRSARARPAGRGVVGGVSASARSRLVSAAVVSRPRARSPARVRNRRAGASSSAALSASPAARARSRAVE